MMLKDNTFCHLLWERASINEYGDVFFCCQSKPGAIGNIYEHDLAYIWQESKQAKLFRRMSLNGSLSCYSSCKLLSKKQRENALGRFYRNRNKLSEAEAAFKDVLKISPKNDDIYAELGWLYKDLGRYAEAEAAFKKALELEPRNAHAYVGSGWLYKDLGRYAEAEAAFKRALALQSNNSNAYIGLGWFYYRRKENYAEAIRLFKKALELNSESCGAYAELGWIYKNQGKPKEAEKSFKKALALNPNTESACLGLGRLYQEQGKFNRAMPLLRKARELNPRNAFTQAILAQIHNGAPLELKPAVLAHQRRRGEIEKMGSENDRTDLDLYERANADYPLVLHIQTGTFCPVNCIMCVQDHRSKTMLNSEVLKRNIDWSRIDNIEIQGGEILAMQNAKELYIWLTEKMQKKINLITNGLLINRGWAERLVKGSNRIVVSVNAATRQTHELINKGSDFARVIRNIKMLIALKRSYSAKINIRYHFTIIPENLHEIAQAIKFAEQLGCDLIDYSFDSPRVEIFLSRHKNIKEKIRNEVSKLADSNLNIKIQRNQLEQLGLLESFNPNLAIDDY